MNAIHNVFSVCSDEKIPSVVHRKAKSIEVKKVLVEQYFFTSEEIAKIFSHSSDEISPYLVDKIIKEISQEYVSDPLELSIHDYLYQVLMSVQEVDENEREQRIVDYIKNLLRGLSYDKMISYTDFIPAGTFANEGLDEHIQAYFTTRVQDFFVVTISKDKFIDDILDKIPSTLRHFFSKQGIFWLNLFVFIHKDGTEKVVFGFQKGTTGSSNDIYFGDLATKYGATKVDMNLSEFIGSDQESSG